MPPRAGPPLPDSVPGWVDRLPPRLAAHARLARLDRPVGIWLLFWPCIVGLGLAAPVGAPGFVLLFLAGAVAMRSAGCVWNDWLDRDLDSQVARTAARPLASGELGTRSALAALAFWLALGFAVWLALPPEPRLIALASLVLVALYPLMKRIVWWPQAWLGLTFNWGLWVGWALAPAGWRPDFGVALLVYGALVAWTLGYDSIYAAQDWEDDALAGIRSSALRLGPARLPLAVGLFYLASLGLAAAGLWLLRPDPVALLALGPFAAHLAWQAWRFRRPNEALALRLFRSNSRAGALLALAFVVAGPLVSWISL